MELEQTRGLSRYPVGKFFRTKQEPILLDSATCVFVGAHFVTHTPIQKKIHQNHHKRA